MKRLAPAQPCPCGGVSTSKASKSLSYGQCCSRWLEAEAAHGPFAPDAHHLMRSRYSACVLEREDYLLATWLEVRDFRSTGADTAEVEFVARQKPTGGPAVRLHERSRFVLEGGRWLYLDGTQF